MNKVRKNCRGSLPTTLATGLTLAIALTLSCTSNIEMPPPPLDNSSSSSENTVPSSSSSSVTNINSGTFLDSRDNKTYKWVKIGDQTWMSENLNYNAPDSRCCGDNTGGDSQNRCGTYGRLYNWATAMAVCPSGWRLPSNAEWTQMVNYVESTNGCTNCAGRYLKATSGWNSYSGIVNLDSYGFSALPGGYGYSGGGFEIAGSGGYWWSASEIGGGGAYYRHIYYYTEDAGHHGSVENSLFSVRCLQD